LEPQEALSAMGFTDLEARLYCELLRQSPLTGYRLSQLVAKAPANTYQALKTLAQKGAVILSEGGGDAKTYRPVPPAELLASLAKNFEERRDHALDALSHVHTAPKGEHVYQLQTVSQVLERAHTMFAEAEEIVLFDFFPGVYELMEESVLSARARGVLVAGVTYDPAHASPTTPFNGESTSVLSNLWPGLGLIVVADGAQQLIAQISRDKAKLMNGIWSDSAFLSATYHSALAAEIRLTALRLDPSDPLKYISLFRAKPPGLRAVLASRTE
jgi:HTH-type transcriptional regulator, sugar sensing transcriptional regulator